MSVLWFALGVLAPLPLLIVQQRRIAKLRRSRRELAGNRDYRPSARDPDEAISRLVAYGGADGRDLGCSSAFAGYAGRHNDEFVGHANPDVAPPDPAERFVAADAASFARTGMQVYEANVQFADVSIPDSAIRAAASAQADQPVGGLIDAIVDITECQRADRLLQESEYKFRALAENMPANAIRFDRQARVLYVNRALMADLAPEFLPVLGKSAVEAYPGNESAAYRQRIIERVIATGTPAELDAVFPNARGEMRVHHIRYVAERDGDGEIIGALAIGRDVTERMRSEAFERFRGRTLELLSGGESLQGVLDGIVRGVELFNSELTCSILLLDGEGERLDRGIAAASSGSGKASIDGAGAGAGPGDGRWRLAAATGRPVLVDDSEVHSYWAPFKELDAGAAVRACWSEPISSSSGQVLGTLAVHHRDAYSPTEFDVSVIEKSARLASVAIESRRAEEALRSSEQEFRTLAENLPDHIARYDRNGRCVFVNRRFAEMLGVEARDLLGRTLLPETFPDQSGAGYLGFLAAVLETGLPAEVDVAWPDAGKGLRYHNVRFVAERGPHGEIVGALAMGRDVTERRHVQRQLEIRNAALNNSNDAVFLMDGNLRFVFVNETACRSLGYSREELLTMGPSDIDPDVTPEMTQGFIRTMTGCGDFLKFETRHRTRDGRVYPVEIGGALFEYEGQTFGLSVVRDITERKRMEDALRFVAQRGRREGGKSFLDALVRYLGQTLGVTCAMVVELGEAPGSAETVAVYAGGKLVPNMRYELAGTPCDDVRGQSYCCYPSGVQRSFPEDRLLAEMGAESYAGIPLWDSRGQPLGLIAILDRKPLLDETWVGQLLQVVAPRAAAELERARSDALLRAREREFRTLAESSPDCITRYDRAGRILYLNSQMVREQGIASAGDVIGRRPCEAWPDGRFADVERAIARAMEAARDVTIEIGLPLPTGERGFSQVRIVPERDDAGAVIGVIAFGRDITELKRYQQSLSAREREFRSLAENAPDNIVRFDRQGRVLYVNPRLERTLAVAAADVVGRMPQEIIPTWDMTPINTVLMTGDPLEMEFAAPDSRGMVRQYQIRLAPERGPQGDIVGVLGIGRDVTRKKRAERDLIILGTAINKASDGIFLFNAQARFAYVNDGACRSLGYSRDELLKMGPADIDVDIKREEVERMLDGLLACGPSLGTIETRHRAADGRIFPVELNASVVEYEDEQLALVVAREITERKRAERDLLVLGSAINKASDGIFLVNERFRFIYVNDRACRALGYSRDELLRMGPSDLDTDIPNEEWALIRAYLVAHGPVVRFETRAGAFDGRAIFVEVTVSLVEHEDEQMALVVARDITERKNMEDTLLRREEEFRSLAENLPDIVMRYDLECRHVYVNPAYMREVEMAEDEVLRTVPDARHWRSSSLSLDAYKARLRQVMTTGDPAELVLDWRRRSDGVAAEYAMRVVAERNADGRVIGALCIGRNVIKLLESERRLQESRRQLRDLAARREDAREEERRHIAREIHDELGQQLSALRFRLTLLAYDFGLAQTEMGKAVDELVGLVGKAIQTTRQVSSALRPAVLDMGIIPALEWLVAEFAPHGGVSFESTEGSGDVRLNSACTIALFRIVQESLTNAVRHSKADRIEVVFGRNADAYVVEVRDNGVGFDPEAPRDRRSVGLVGMRERTFAVGGELVVDSREGRGTTLRVRIPAATDGEEES